MKDLEQLGRELERSGKAGQLKKLAESADGQNLSRMIDSRAVEKAVRGGDSEAMRSILSQVLSTDEGKRLASDLSRLFGGK